MSPRSCRPGHTYLAGAPLFVAHRGGSKVAPENTMEAFRRAVRVWEVDMLEMDVRLTRDGEVVVIHDATVDRTTDGTGTVASRSMRELLELDAGARFRDADGAPVFQGRGVRVPRFEDVLVAFPDVRINVEAKERQAAAPLVDIIRRHRAESRVLVAAEFEKARADVRGYPGPWGASRHHVALFWLLHRLPGGSLYTPGADILQVPETWKGRRIVTPRFIREAHARNIPVQVWTVDDADDMRRLLAWGIDGIQTDRPDVLARVMVEELGRPAPPGLRAP
ncbi:MAG TPA: glycerophosphodiester phosphodiesterase [Longimicrobiales bacterium]|nr:glycerophosphodiester phosphodiesterase [Longimicrobiales bacterium]